MAKTARVSATKRSNSGGGGNRPSLGRVRDEGIAGAGAGAGAGSSARISRRRGAWGLGPAPGPFAKPRSGG